MEPTFGEMADRVLGWYERDTANHPSRRWFDNPQTRFLINKFTGVITDLDLKVAISLLDQMEFVGIFENLVAIIYLLGLRFPEAREQPKGVINGSDSFSKHFITTSINTVAG